MMPAAARFGATSVAISACDGPRRADWRFLLPTPPSGRFRHLVVLGSTPQFRAQLLELGVAVRVDGDLPADHRVDAVVVLHHAFRDIPRAAAAVETGGVFYCEVDRRQPRAMTWSPRRVNRMLGRAGLTSRGIWWVIPGFDDSKRFVPLDAPSAVAWYLDAVYPRSSARRALLVAAVRAWTRASSHRFCPLAPSFSVVAVAPPLALTAPSVLRDFRPVGAHCDPDTRVALITSGQDDGSRVVMVPFDANGSPTAVVKVARLPSFNDHTVREQATMVMLRSRLDHAMLETVPTPLGSGFWNGCAVAAETFAPGPTCVVSSGAWGIPARRRLEDLRLATDWLVEFNKRWEVARPNWCEAQTRRCLEHPLRAYEQAWQTTVAERRLFARMRDEARMLFGAVLPVVLLHKDFGPWNVHRGRRLTVIDWEFAGSDPLDRAGPAGLDLVYFVVHWLHVVRRLKRDRDKDLAFEELFLSPKPRADALRARQALGSYVRRLGIDRRFLPLLVALTWIGHAIDRAGRGTDPAGARNRYAEYVDLLAHGADALFRLEP
jgi:hypothetical protein